MTNYGDRCWSVMAGAVSIAGVVPTSKFITCNIDLNRVTTHKIIWSRCALFVTMRNIARTPEERRCSTNTTSTRCRCRAVI
jgi:hypothetical protein